MLSTAEMIEHYRLTLLRLVAGLFVQAGIEPAGEGVKTLSRTVRASILLVLRQVESSARRLIFVETRGLDIPDYVPPPKRGRVKRKSGNDAPRSGTARTPMFRLIDPRKWFWTLGTKSRPRAKHMPWISSFDEVRPAPPEAPPLPTDDDPMDAASICNRLVALKAAMDDLPKQAKRMARLRAWNEQRSILKSPLRPGLPPGWRERGQDEIDEVLREAHQLAVRAKQAPDTS